MGRNQTVRMTKALNSRALVLTYIQLLQQQQKNTTASNEVQNTAQYNTDMALHPSAGKFLIESRITRIQSICNYRK